MGIRDALVFLSLLQLLHHLASFTSLRKRALTMEQRGIFNGSLVYPPEPSDAEMQGIEATQTATPANLLQYAYNNGFVRSPDAMYAAPFNHYGQQSYCPAVLPPFVNVQTSVPVRSAPLGPPAWPLELPRMDRVVPELPIKIKLYEAKKHLDAYGYDGLHRRAKLDAYLDLMEDNDEYFQVRRRVMSIRAPCKTYLRALPSYSLSAMSSLNSPWMALTHKASSAASLRPATRVSQTPRRATNTSTGTSGPATSAPAAAASGSTTSTP